MTDDTIEHGGYISPPIRTAVQSGYRVGETFGEDGGWGTEIIENASGRILAVTYGVREADTEADANMIVACLNRVPK